MASIDRSYQKRCAFIAGLLMMAGLAAAPLALATNSLMTTARQQYPKIIGTRLDSCSLCHTAGSSLDSFGRAFRDARRSFTAIEAADTDGDGFTNLVEIQSLTFPGNRSDFPSASLLYFPLLRQSAARSTGFAVTNMGAGAATVVFSAFDDAGNSLPSSTPGSFTMQPAHQLAAVAPEVFGAQVNSPGAWVRVAATGTGVAGFFLEWDADLRAMDGAAAAVPRQEFILPEVGDAEIHILNPSLTQTAAVTVRLQDLNGSEAGSRQVALGPGARHAASAAELFDPARMAAGGYLRISANLPVAAIERIEYAGAWESILPALDADGGARVTYCPQFAAGGGIWCSRLTVINLEAMETNVSLSLVDAQGERIGQSFAVRIPALGKAVVDDPTVFGLAASDASVVEGYVRMESSAGRITGCVRFGDPRGAQFQTALAFTPEAHAQLLYSQVAQDDTWFTGLAVVNPNDQPATVTICVHGTDGSLAGSADVTIPASGRVSRLLYELVPGLPSLSRGYFTLSSTQPVFSFALFGTHSLSVLAAVPPQ